MYYKKTIEQLKAESKSLAAKRKKIGNQAKALRIDDIEPLYKNRQDYDCISEELSSILKIIAIKEAKNPIHCF